MLKNHEYFLKEALKEAQKAFDKQEVPVGAIIVKDGEIIAKAYNKREHTNNISSHAEILAMQKASKKLNTWKLYDCDIYITLEPCLMCYGAIKQSRINNIYIGLKGNQNKEYSYNNYIEDEKVKLINLKENSHQLMKRFFGNKR